MRSRPEFQEDSEIDRNRLETRDRFYEISNKIDDVRMQKASWWHQLK